MVNKRQIHFFITEELNKEVVKITKKLGMSKSEIARYGLFEALVKLKNVVGDEINGKEKG